jgi:hypothetical protein
MRKLKMKPWTAWGIHNGGLEAQNGVIEGSGNSQWSLGGSKWSFRWHVVITDSHHYDEDHDPHRNEKYDQHQTKKSDPNPDPHQSEKRDPDPGWHQNDVAPQHWLSEMSVPGGRMFGLLLAAPCPRGVQLTQNNL